MDRYITSLQITIIIIVTVIKFLLGYTFVNHFNTEVLRQSRSL